MDFRASGSDLVDVCKDAIAPECDWLTNTQEMTFFNLHKRLFGGVVFSIFIECNNVYVETWNSGYLSLTENSFV